MTITYRDFAATWLIGAGRWAEAGERSVFKKAIRSSRSDCTLLMYCFVTVFASP